MEREQIIREDFPLVRKGWDPEAVRAHLRAVADAAPARGAGTPLADGAAERVHAVIAAAEEVAERIEEQSRREAEEFLNSIRDEADGALSRARAEADELIASARTEAAERVEQAKAAVEGLISQAGELRSRVGDLGDQLVERNGPQAEVTPPAPGAPVPGPPSPAPTPDPVPEPTPDPEPPTPAPDPGPPVPEPTPGPPVPEPDPGPPAPVPEPDPPVPNPDPTPPEPAPTPQPAPDPAPPEPQPAPDPPESASTEDLIAQLRSGGSAAAPEPNGSKQARPFGAGGSDGADADAAAIRLVAMNMALEGSSREEIEARIEADFGSAPGASALIDDVLSRTAGV
jgi:F0F1-type ATP synthase membrane subunit b/b'